MEVTIKIEKKVQVKTLYVSAGVRYWEDAIVNGNEDQDGKLIPCREGDSWEPIIDVDTGVILNWQKGVEADIHYKVCDDGHYELRDNEGEPINGFNGYVPSIMCPAEEGYGEYIIMKVDKNGKIDEWEPNLDDFFNE